MAIREDYLGKHVYLLETKMRFLNNMKSLKIEL